MELVSLSWRTLPLSQITFTSEYYTTKSTRSLTIYSDFSFRSFLDGLYAVSDLLLENRPDPKPPDTERRDVKVEPPHSDGIRLPLTGVTIVVSSKLTWTKKRSFDLFVKRRRKKCDDVFETIINFNCGRIILAPYANGP